jgi:hypothetical protein
MKIHFVLIFTILNKFSFALDATAWCSTKLNGLYSNPEVTDCTQYVKCYPYNGNMIGAVYNCIGTTLFNPQVSYCEPGYVCGAQTSTVQTTTASSAFNANNWCATQNKGYHAYPVDSTNCIDFVYCYLSNGVMMGNVYSCTGSTRFNPTALYCQPGYSCQSTTTSASKLILFLI